MYCDLFPVHKALMTSRKGISITSSRMQGALNALGILKQKFSIHQRTSNMAADNVVDVLYSICSLQSHLIGKPSDDTNMNFDKDTGDSIDTVRQGGHAIKKCINYKEGNQSQRNRLPLYLSCSY